MFIRRNAAFIAPIYIKPEHKYLQQLLSAKLHTQIGCVVEITLSCLSRSRSGLLSIFVAPFGLAHKARQAHAAAAALLQQLSSPSGCAVYHYSREYGESPEGDWKRGCLPGWALAAHSSISADAEQVVPGTWLAGMCRRHLPLRPTTHKRKRLSSVERTKERIPPRMCAHGARLQPRGRRLRATRPS